MSTWLMCKAESTVLDGKGRLVKVITDGTLSSMSCYDWLRLGPVMDAPAWSGCTDWEGQAWEGLQIFRKTNI
jgi:hypothetical protein